MGMARKNGFTVIELVMAMVIVGILSAAALAKYSDVGDTAKKTAREGGRETLGLKWKQKVLEKSGEASPYPRLIDLVEGEPGSPASQGYRNSGLSGLTGGKLQGYGDTIPLSVCPPVGSMEWYDPGNVMAAATLAQLQGSGWAYAPTFVAAMQSRDFEPPAWAYYMHISTPDWPGPKRCFITMKLAFGSDFQVDLIKEDVPATGDTPGILPLAADNSGICVASGWRLPTYAMGGALTAASTDKVASIGTEIVEDAANCP